MRGPAMSASSGMRGPASGKTGCGFLRFFRFHAWYGQGAPDPIGLSACAELRGAIDALSGERVREELLKLLRAPEPVATCRSMLNSGVMAHALPGPVHIETLARLVALEQSLSLLPDPLRRLATLTGPLSPEAVLAIKSRLRLANRDAGYLMRLETAKTHLAAVAAGDFRRALYCNDPHILLDATLLARAETGAPALDRIVALRDFIENWRGPTFPVTGADLMARGIPAGPSLGALLGALEAWWIDRDFAPDRAACLVELDRRLAG